MFSFWPCDLYAFTGSAFFFNSVVKHFESLTTIYKFIIVTIIVLLLHHSSMHMCVYVCVCVRVCGVQMQKRERHREIGNAFFKIRLCILL